MSKKELRGIIRPEDKDSLKEALRQGARGLPSVSIKKQIGDGRDTRRITRSIILPAYVWEEIEKRRYENKKPTGAVICEALKATGWDILDIDLEDQRKMRT